MAIHTRDVDDVAVLDIDGRLTAGRECQDLNQAVRALVGAGRSRVLLDLDELRYIDSCGVGELIAAYTAVKKSGGDLKLASPQEAVQKIFEIVQLAQVVEIYPTQGDALGSFT